MCNKSFHMIFQNLLMLVIPQDKTVSTLSPDSQLIYPFFCHYSLQHYIPLLPFSTHITFFSLHDLLLLFLTCASILNETYISEDFKLSSTNESKQKMFAFLSVSVPDSELYFIVTHLL